jgi:Fur family ferric uptake transcriptional regulator
VNVGREDFSSPARSRTAWTRNQRRSAQNVSPALEIIQRTLVAEGHSQTKPRRQVLQVFLENDQPLTPAAVHKRLAGRKINLASVYRAIELFCRVRVLTEVDHVQKGRRYELSDEYRNHHHHLICGSCGKTEDFEDCELEDLERLIRKRFHFKVTRHDLRFIGLCQRCQP